MKILVVAARYDYGDPVRGDSVDHYQMYVPLARLFPGTELFDFLTRVKAVGKQMMNVELLDAVRSLRPDVTIVSLYGNEFEPEVIRALRRWTTTLAYFYDDIWRRAYAAKWARHFDFITTSDPGGATRIASAGPGNAIYCPFTFDERLFARLDLPLEYDVSFVGLHHPYRAWVVARLRRAGINVATFGHGWPTGRLALPDVVNVFNSTKINLNISNSSHWDPAFLAADPLALPRMLKLGKHREQVKVRHFEIAGSGGFQLSYAVDYLTEFFVPGVEIATYATVDELVSKVRHFLRHEEEREAIADGGWRRAQREHTSTRRYSDLMSELARRTDGFRHRHKPVQAHQ